MKNNIFAEELIMDYDLYINLIDGERMSSFHAVSKTNPIVRYRDRHKIKADLVIR